REVDGQHARTPDSRRAEPAGPLHRWIADVLVIDPLITVVPGKLVARVQVVIDLDVDLPVVCVVTGAGSCSEVGLTVGAAYPLVNRRVQPVTAIENIGMR